ncbi:MAG: hypothetical protein H7A25_15200 [Leptospiraceae bacterium]|nr:hypothetical protein [Leptospiraceae bacterium]MCP5501246.1 hypothetical protein [Leptospiraceae bacterium]
MPLTAFLLFLNFLIPFIFFSLAYSEHLSTGVIVTWDNAADMLLTNLIRENHILLTGHYSRFVIHHPGPFFFYTNYIFETLFSVFFESRYNTWFLAAICLNSFFISIGAYLTGFYFPKRDRLLTGIFYSLSSLYFFRFFPADTLLSMPVKVVLPFLSFISAIPLLLGRNLPKILPFLIFLNLVLVHAYIGTAILSSILMLIFLVPFLKQKPSLFQKPILLSFLLIFLFSAPFLIDLFFSKTSNFQEIIKFLKYRKPLFPKPNWQETFEFTFLFWKTNLNLWTLLGIIPFLLLLLLQKKQKPKKLLLFHLLSTGIFTIFFIVYHRFSVKPLLEFTGYYNRMLPVNLLILIVLYSSGTYYKKYIFLKRFLLILLSFILSVFLVQHIRQKKNPPLSYPFIKQISETIIRQKPESIRIGYFEHMDWPYIAGILLYLRDKGQAACTDKKHMAFLYTENAICKENEKPNFLLYNKANCPENPLLIVNNYCLIQNQ